MKTFKLDIHGWSEAVFYLPSQTSVPWVNSHDVFDLGLQTLNRTGIYTYKRISCKQPLHLNKHLLMHLKLIHLQHRPKQLQRLTSQGQVKLFIDRKKNYLKLFNIWFHYLHVSDWPVMGLNIVRHFFNYWTIDTLELYWLHMWTIISNSCCTSLRISYAFPPLYSIYALYLVIST